MNDRNVLTLLIAIEAQTLVREVPIVTTFLASAPAIDVSGTKGGKSDDSDGEYSSMSCSSTRKLEL